MRVGEVLTQPADGGGGEHHVADLSQAEQKYAQLMTAEARPMTRLSDSGLHRGFVDQHDGDIVLDRVDALARAALESRAVLYEDDRRFTVGTRENFEQFGVDGHAALYDTFTLLWNNSLMKLRVFAAVVSLLALPVLARAQGAQDRSGEAYAEFLNGRHLETTDNIEGAITAFKHAAQLDPRAADVVAELAGLYMRQSRLDEAITAGEQALKITPANREAHRVLGIVYATLVESGRRQNGRQTQTSGAQAENLAKAIQHLEQAIDRQSESDPNIRATLSRLYMAAGAYDKAIPLLLDLVSQEPGWSDGPSLLVQAYAGAGRDADAVAWLERAAPDNPGLFTTLAEFYERERRW